MMDKLKKHAAALITQSEGRRTNSLLNSARKMGFEKSADVLEGIIPDRRRAEDFEFIRGLLYLMENSVLKSTLDESVAVMLEKCTHGGRTMLRGEYEEIVGVFLGESTGQVQTANTQTTNGAHTMGVESLEKSVDKVENLARSLADFLVSQEQRPADIDESRVKEIARGVVEEVIRDNVRVLDIKVNDAPPIRVEGAHVEFDTVMALVANRLNVMMVGPAGSGKTSLAHQAADALGLEFYSISCGPQTSKTDLMGYMDATGNYVPSLFRRAYEGGGVFLFDEMDAANAAVLTIINAATANGSAGFPDKVVERHADFVVCAAANTYGRGADRQYVGRQKLDEATLDRFLPVEIGYDDRIERALAAGNQKWLETVWAVRRAVDDLKVRHIVSTRAVANGAKLLAAGMARDKVMELVLWKGLDSGTREQVRARAGV